MNRTSLFARVALGAALAAAFGGRAGAQGPEGALPGVTTTLAAVRASQASFEPTALTLTIALAFDAAPLIDLKRADLVRAKCVVAAGPDRQGKWAETSSAGAAGMVSLLPGESFTIPFVVTLPEGIAPPGAPVSLQWIGPASTKLPRSNELAVTLRDAKNPTATLETSEGRVVIELWPDVAPNHVANFVALAKKGFYDGLKWHRVVPNFVVQTGCPRGDGQGDAGYKIKAEFNDMPFGKGVVGMARGGDNDSAGSQFFLCVADALALNKNYTAFGRILEGQEVADRISNVARDPKTERPLKDVALKSVAVALPPTYAAPEVKKA